VLVPNHELCVGDVMVLDTGDKVAADCLLLETFGLVVDEASLTGESDPIAKTPASDPWIRSGTQVGGVVGT
jgi:P-type Ca2+ transporter type 2C